MRKLLFVLFLLALAVPARATCTSPCIGFGTGAGAAGGTTSSFTSTGATLLACSVTTFNKNITTMSVSDSNGNTWHALPTQATGSGTIDGGMWYAYDHGGTPLVVGAGQTVTLSLASSFAGFVCAAFSGTLTGSVDPKDQTNGSASGGSIVTTIQPGSITPTSNGQLLLTSSGIDQGGGGGYTINSSFNVITTVAFSSGTNEGSSLSYFLQSTAAAINPTWTFNTTFGGDAMSTIVSMKPTAASTFVSNPTIIIAGP